MSEVDGQLELPYDDLPEPEPEPDALTAFLVIVDHSGAAVATGDLGQELTVERIATVADMRRACLEVSADIAALHTAEQVAKAMKAQEPPAPAARVRRRMQERGIYPDRPIDAGNR
jgi:hypothetical protein